MIEKFSKIPLLAILICGLFALAVRAQESSGNASRNATAPWQPPPPSSDDFDWIQLKSGEWLKGKLKSLQDHKLEFDSEELDLQEFDWEDVYQVRSPRLTEVLFNDKILEAGPIEITREKVTVKTAAGEKQFDRNELVAVTPGGPREINHWSGKISAGFAMRSGNTEEKDFNASANLKRRTPETRLSVDYIGNLNSVQGVETANDHRASVLFDFWLSPKFFIRAPFLEYYHDPIQNIDRRFTGGAGVGYEMFDRPGLNWNVMAGPAYQHTRFESVETGQPDAQGYGAMVFITDFEADITKRLDLLSQYRLIYTKQEAGGYTHHWQTTLEIELTKRFELDVSFIWDRVSHPTVRFGGTTPEANDFRTVLSLGVNF